MRLSTMGALALAVGGTYGYLDSHPFFMFSTSELLTTTSKLQTASSIIADVGLSLSQCPSEYYILIEQQGVNARDYESKQNSPVLAQRLSRTPKSGIRSSLAVTDVVGEVDPSTWIELLQSTCAVKTTTIDASKGEIPATFATAPALIIVRLPPVSRKSRSDDLAKSDALFATILDLLPKEDYTVLYTTTRSCRGRVSGQPVQDSKVYEMDSTLQDAMHLDLKRDLGALVQNSSKSGNQTLIDGPLFDRYQFFTPGIFMGLLAGFFLLSILYVALSAISSLQVTYAAFDKETGALAGKKVQ